MAATVMEAEEGVVACDISEASLRTAQRVSRFLLEHARIVTGDNAGVTKVNDLLVCPEVNRAYLRTFLAAATAVIARAVVSGQRHVHAAASRAAIAASLHAYAIGL